MNCKRCQKEFHSCGNCYNDIHWESSHCSSACWEQTAKTENKYIEVSNFISNLSEFDFEKLYFWFWDADDESEFFTDELLRRKRENCNHKNTDGYNGAGYYRKFCKDCKLTLETKDTTTRYRLVKQ